MVVRITKDNKRKKTMGVETFNHVTITKSMET